MNFSFWLDNEEFALKLVEQGKNRLQVSLGKKTYEVSVEQICGDEVLLNVDGKVYNLIINSNSSTSYSVYLDGKTFTIEKRSATQILGVKAERAGRKDIKTSMPGRIVKVLVNDGDKVNEGQAVLVLEAMKMQNEIKSPQSGTIVKISPKDGDSVEAGALLFSVE